MRPYESVHEAHGPRAEQLAMEVTQRLPAIAALAGSVRVVEEGVQERSAQAWLHARDPCCGGAGAAHTTWLCGVGRHNMPGSAARVNEALEVSKTQIGTVVARRAMPRSETSAEDAAAVHF